MRRGFKTEAEMAAVVVTWLREQGWDVFQKVWLSVADERVYEFDGMDIDELPDFSAEVWEVAVENSSNSSRVRVIVQPLPSPDERGGKEGSREEGA